jgi:HNH endonuclease
MSPSSSVRGLSPDWVTVRETILKRDNYRCVECGIPCTHSEADIHHLLPRSVGGSDEPSNLVSYVTDATLLTQRDHVQVTLKAFEFGGSRVGSIGSSMRCEVCGDLT